MFYVRTVPLGHLLSPATRLYPCGGVGAGQACRAVTGGEGAVRTHVGEAHQGVGNHSDVVGCHQGDVVRGAALAE